MSQKTQIEKKPIEQIIAECEGSCCDCMNDDDINCLLVNKREKTRFNLNEEYAEAERAIQNGNAPKRSLFEIAQDLKALDNRG
jgi:hypothetical protein